MVRVNVRTPPCAEQPAPAPPSPGGTKSNNAVPGAGDGGQQHCKQTGLCTLVIIVRRSPLIGMSKHS